MKKLLLFVTIFSVLFGISLFVAQKDAVFAFEENFDCVVEWEEFCKMYPDRTAFSQGEKDAGEYIAAKFSDYGLKGYFLGEFKQNIDYYEGYSTQNIVGIKKAKNNTAKTVVIGAHYDNVVIDASCGANDNASGVAVLLALAQRFKNLEFDFNILFVAFGAEEVGMYGSSYFVGQLTQVQLENMLLYINIDSIASGDNLYLYAEDIPTNFSTFFLDNYNGAQANLKNLNSPPADLGIYYSENYYIQKPYSATYFYTDAVSFRSSGVPSLSFFAGNLEYAYGYVESKNESACVSHTNGDTIQNIASFGNDYNKNMQSVFVCIYSALESSEFLSVATSAKTELVSSVWYFSGAGKIVTIVMLLMSVCFSVSIYRKLQKRATMNEQPIKNFKIFFQPNDEEVFTF